MKVKQLTYLVVFVFILSAAVNYAYSKASVCVSKEKMSSYIYIQDRVSITCSQSLNQDCLNARMKQNFPNSDDEILLSPGVLQNPIDDYLLQPLYTVKENQKRTYCRLNTFLKN
jgi:hypothetical protein